MKSKIAQNLSYSWFFKKFDSNRDSPQQINCENFIIGCTGGFQAILDQRQVFTTLDENWIAHALYLSARSCGSKNFNIELQEETFGTHLRKHLRLLVGYCETSVTGGHARLDHNVHSESTWSSETSIPQNFSVIEILQNEKYITKSSKYSTYDFYPTGRFFRYNRNLNYSAAIITIISTSKGVNYFA